MLVPGLKMPHDVQSAKNNEKRNEYMIFLLQLAKLLGINLNIHREQKSNNLETLYPDEKKTPSYQHVFPSAH